MAAVEERNFRELLALAWENGCRPREVWIITPRHVDPDQDIFSPTESKGEKRHRIW